MLKRITRTFPRDKVTYLRASNEIYVVESGKDDISSNGNSFSSNGFFKQSRNSHELLAGIISS